MFVSQSRYLATVVGRLCCTRSLILNNATYCVLDRIITQQVEVASFSWQSPIIGNFYIKGFAAILHGVIPYVRRCYVVPVNSLLVDCCVCLSYYISSEQF